MAGRSNFFGFLCDGVIGHGRRRGLETRVRCRRVPLGGCLRRARSVELGEHLTVAMVALDQMRMQLRGTLIRALAGGGLEFQAGRAGLTRLPAALHPELHPAEALWVHIDEPSVNRHFDTLADLDSVVAERCVALEKDRDLIRGQTGFHWWPNRIYPI